MKRKLVALICAFAMVIALPASAWAAGSPSKATSNTGYSDEGTSLVVSGKALSSNYRLIVRPVNFMAFDYNLTSAMFVVGNFEMYDEPEGSTDGTYTFTFGGLSQYNGATVTILIKYKDGTTEVKTAKVSNGTVTITADGLGWATIVVDGDTVVGGATGAASASTDASATSPQTDVDLSGVAGATALCAAAATGVGIALRKKTVR